MSTLESGEFGFAVIAFALDTFNTVTEIRHLLFCTL